MLNVSFSKGESVDDLRCRTQVKHEKTPKRSRVLPMKTCLRTTGVGRACRQLALRWRRIEEESFKELHCTEYHVEG